MLLMEQQQQQQQHQNQAQLGNPGMNSPMMPPGANPIIPGSMANHPPPSVPFNNLHILQKQLQQNNNDPQQQSSPQLQQQQQHMMFRQQQQQQQPMQQNFPMNMPPRGLRPPASLPAPQPVTPPSHGVRFMPMMPPSSMQNMNQMSPSMMQQIAMMRKQQQQDQARARKLMMAQHRKAALEARLRNKAPHMTSPNDPKSMPQPVPTTCIPQSVNSVPAPIPMNISLTATPQGPQFVPKQLIPRTTLPSPISIPDDQRLVPVKTPVVQQVPTSDPLSLPKSTQNQALPPKTIPWRSQANKVPLPIPASSINQTDKSCKQNADSTIVNVSIR